MEHIITSGERNVMELRLDVLVLQEGEFYVAYCPSLSISSYGESIYDAKLAFQELMQDMIEEWELNGKLKNDLEQHGWAIKSNNDITPPNEINLDIPAGLLKQQFHSNHRIAVC